MKPIIQTNLLPKFLVVNDVAAKATWNKYLPMPWKEGEMVRVHPEQTSTKMKPEAFAKNYVRVIRKGHDGEWNVINTSFWSHFSLLTKKSK